MGRRKLPMAFMENKKQRMVTFKKRKEGVMKMLHQITTLCGVGASMIIHDSDNHKTSIWPPEKPEEVRRMIDVYENSDSVKWYTLPDYFGERQRKVEKETMKLRSEKYAIGSPRYGEAVHMVDLGESTWVDGEKGDEALVDGFAVFGTNGGSCAVGGC